MAALILAGYVATLVVFRNRMYFYMFSAGFATFVLLSELVILIFMKIKTSRLGCFKLLQSTINSIYAQFGVFVAVYFLIIVFYITRLLTKDKFDKREEIGFGILNIVIKQFFFSIPIIHIVYAHQTSLSKEIVEGDSIKTDHATPPA